MNSTTTAIQNERQTERVAVKSVLRNGFKAISFPKLLLSTIIYIISRIPMAVIGAIAAGISVLIGYGIIYCGSSLLVASLDFSNFIFVALGVALSAIVLVAGLVVGVSLLYLGTVVVLGFDKCIIIGIKAYTSDRTASCGKLFSYFRYFKKAMWFGSLHWIKTIGAIVIPQIILSLLFTPSTVYDLWFFWILVFAGFGISVCIINSFKYYSADFIFSENPSILGSTASKDDYMHSATTKVDSAFLRKIVYLWSLFRFYAFEKTGASSVLDASDEFTSKEKVTIFLLSLLFCAPIAVILCIFSIFFIISVIFTIPVIFFIASGATLLLLAIYRIITIFITGAFYNLKKNRLS